MTRDASEELSDGVLASCAAESTTAVTFLTTGFSFCTALWVTFSAVKSNNEKRDKDANHDELDDVEGLTESVVTRSRSIECSTVTWGSRRARRAIKDMEWSFGLEAGFVWWWVIEFGFFVTWPTVRPIMGSVMTWWSVMPFMWWSPMVAMG
jgi:hypothetical protein